MVWVPSGDCELGPVDGFWIDACPVTNHEYAEFTGDTGYRTAAWPDTGRTPWRYRAGRDDHPVTMVSWADAVAYAAWTGKALPTEAEWVCAAHDAAAPARGVAGIVRFGAGKARADAGIAGIAGIAGSAGGGSGTRPVAGGRPNGYGLYDMVGSVWEWTADWHGFGGPVPYKVVRGGRTRGGRPHPVHGYAGNLGFRCVVRTG
jgi:formylglycine-generating enzyme required for sulfatase activity